MGNIFRNKVQKFELFSREICFVGDFGAHNLFQTCCMSFEFALLTE